MSSELVHVTVNGNVINSTTEHPFYVPKKGWTAAIELRAGDVLVALNGELAVVENVQHEILEAPVAFYNFEVEDDHTYFVGDVGVAVHNTCVPLNGALSARLKNDFGWTDNLLKKCTFGDDGVITIRTINSAKAGQVHNGVLFEERTIKLADDITIQGVFPKFDSVFDPSIPKEMYKSSDDIQFKECNKQLKKAIEDDSVLKSKFTELQISDIMSGKTPTEYTWHHNEEPGKLQLVLTTQQNPNMNGVGHTGGRALWGGGSTSR